MPVRDHFSSLLFQIFTEFSSSRLLLAGHWNLLLGLLLDRTGLADKCNAGDRVLQGNVMSGYDLTDIWHLLHPVDREFTHLSNVHGTSLHTDYILAESALLPYVSHCHILEGSLSDHSML